MANKLNLKTINKAEKHTFTQKTITIPIDGKEYEVKIDTVFRQTKIQEMITKFLTSKNFQDFNVLDDAIKLSYYMFMILKNMTDLEIPEDITLAQEINLINSLIDLGIWEAIFAEISEDEINKVNKYLKKFNENLGELTKDGKGIDELVKSVGNELDELDELDGESGDVVG